VRTPRSIRDVALAVAGALLAGLGIAACGPFGDGEELSKAEFIARGDEICKEGRAKYLELQKEPPQSAAEAAELTRSLIEITEDEIDELRDLNAPPGSEDALEDYLDSRQAGLDVLEDGLAAAEDENAGKYAEAQGRVAREQVDRARLAEKVGFSECSQPLTGGSGGG
jgi:hypothetical protein